MEKFNEQVKLFLSLRELSDQYRLCWIPSGNIYSIIEFFDEELPKIDPKKVELIII